MIPNERVLQVRGDLWKRAGSGLSAKDEEDLFGICDELLALRALVLASRPALEAGAMHLEAGAIAHRGIRPHKDLPKSEAKTQLRQSDMMAEVNDKHAAQLRTLSAYGVGK